MIARTLPGWVEAVVLPLINLFLAFLVLGLVLVLLFAAPNEGAWWHAPGHYLSQYVRLLFGLMDTVLTGSISTPTKVEIAGRVFEKPPNFRPFSNVLFYATSLTFTGLAVALAFRAGHFNIGGEGQMMLGGVALGVLVAAMTQMTDGELEAYALVAAIGPWGLIPLLFLAAGLFGALWILIPALLQAYRGSHIVITTIMFNAIAAGVLTYVLKVEGFIKRPLSSELATPQAPEVFRIPGLPFPEAMPVSGDNGNLLFFVALAAAGLVWAFLRYTKLGFAVRTTGQNTDAARSAGIDPRKVTVIALCLSGMLAGFAAANHVLTNGSAFSLKEGFSAGLGFTGIAVALLARNHPLAIPLTALVFGVLIQGGVAVQTEWNGRIDSSIAEAMQGLIVLFIGAFALLLRWPARWVWGHMQTWRQQQTSSGATN